VLATESGILAASHLVGASGVNDCLKSHNLKKMADAYGTKPVSYMRLLAGYNINEVK
jgi:hypothetical protein